MNLDTKLHEVPKEDLNPTIVRRLEHYGIGTVGELTSLEAKEILRIKLLGRQSLAEIDMFLAKNDLSLKNCRCRNARGLLTRLALSIIRELHRYKKDVEIGNFRAGEIVYKLDLSYFKHSFEITVRSK